MMCSLSSFLAQPGGAPLRSSPASNAPAVHFPPQAALLSDYNVSVGFGDAVPSIFPCSPMTASQPSVVIVGRPNVGKSALFNRLTGTRRSIVTDEPGITRDRIYGSVSWNGHSFQLVDTGGIVPDDRAAIPREILRQARVAIDAASILLLVVDSRAGLTPLDSELARLLRRSGKPLYLVANKVDTPQWLSLAAPFHQLGTHVFPVSCEHGLGIAEMLDALLTALSKSGSLPPPQEPLPADASASVRIAIVGRPNVGKSTLLNALAGEERSIVSEQPGTTRDAVDTTVRRASHSYTFIDTAGIRRKGKTKLVAEKLSVVMARRHLERADIALMVVDAEQGVTSSDATIASYTQQSGRSVIIVMNKFDLALQHASAAASRPAPQRRASFPVRTSGRGKIGRRNKLKSPPQAARSASSASFGSPISNFEFQISNSRSSRVDPGRLMADYEKIVRAKLKFLDYAPVVFLSAKSAQRVEKLFPLIDSVAAARRHRISTGELNRWLKEVDLDRGSSPSSRKVKIYYLTQATSAPPTFVLFTNQLQPLHFSYQRFLENQLRARFDFLGTPIHFTQRLKKR